MATPKTAADLRKIIAQHQADIQRLGSAWGQIVADHLDDADRQTLAFIREKLSKLQYDRNTAAGIKQLDTIRASIEKIRVKAYRSAEADIRGKIADLMTNEVKWSRRLLQSFAGARKVKSALKSYTKDEKSAEMAQKWLDEFVREQQEQAGIVDAAMKVYREASPELIAKVVKAVEAIAKEPMVTQSAIDRLRKSAIVVNKTYNEWWTRTADADVSRVCDAVQKGVNDGATIEQMTRTVAGTKKGGYADGILSTNRSHARSMVRTICCGMANAAKDEFYAKNADVVKSVEWLSTLDGRTCAACASLDHQRWKNNAPHPIPPEHPSCRCVLLPVTELTDLVDGTRPQANADFMEEARRMYEEKYPKKNWDDLSQSTKKKYYYEAMKEYEARTGKPAYSLVSGKTSFREYFDGMSDQQKRDWLGAERYKLYKQGKANIDDFIPPYPDDRMSVAELKARDKASFE